MNEQRARDLLRDAVADVQPQGEGWADVQRRVAAAEAKAPRRFRLGLLAAAAVVAVAAAVAVLGRDNPVTKVTTPAHPTTTPDRADTPTTGRQTSTSEAASPAMPATLVGTRSGSTQLVTADTATGRTRAVLAVAPPRRVIESLSLSPDGTYAYFHTGPEPVAGQLWRVPVAGGPVEELGAGTYPVVSPDGKKLAYARMGELVVRDVAGGPERVRDVSAQQDGSEGIVGVAWTAAGEVVYDGANGAGPVGWYVIDAALANQPRPLRPDAAHQGSFWSSASTRGYDGLVGFVEQCCITDATPTEPAPPSSLVVVDPATGKTVGRTLLTAEVRHMDYDASGRHQVFTGEGHRLYRRSGGPLIAMAGDFDLAVW
jgi:hypothetical protein